VGFAAVNSSGVLRSSYQDLETKGIGMKNASPQKKKIPSVYEFNHTVVCIAGICCDVVVANLIKSQFSLCLNQISKCMHS
jgi:hypothetical protein